MQENYKYKQPAWMDDAISNSITKFLQKLFLLAPLTLMVFLRWNIGFRLMHPLTLLAGMVGIMSLGGPPLYSPLYLFWSAALAFGLVKTANRCIQDHKGIPQHSYYIGDSIFNALPIPEFFRRRRRMAFFFEPVFCVTVGIVILKYAPSRLHELAVWIIVSACLLICLEIDTHRKQRKREMDLIDGMVYSEFQGGHVERYSEEPQHSAPQLQQTEGIPTGLGADIKQQVNQRQRKK